MLLHVSLSQNHFQPTFYQLSSPRFRNYVNTLLRVGFVESFSKKEEVLMKNALSGWPLRTPEKCDLKREEW
ncbi:hypothetical protein [Brevibacillus laterosporus]|uniref:hypothetical protein n=1 Tax=Brevibacillus laterosporus TaxID=1465 RepID=UPI00265D0F69|nr:hypothetical protein [Brevibacillus laterosporus]